MEWLNGRVCIFFFLSIAGNSASACGTGPLDIAYALIRLLRVDSRKFAHYLA